MFTAISKKLNHSTSIFALHYEKYKFAITLALIKQNYMYGGYFISYYVVTFLPYHKYDSFATTEHHQGTGKSSITKQTTGPEMDFSTDQSHITAITPHRVHWA